MANLLDLWKKTKDYFNPVSNAGNNFWSSPTANKLSNIQRIVTNPQTGQNVGNWLRNTANQQATWAEQRNAPSYIPKTVRFLGDYGGNFAQAYTGGIVRGGTGLARTIAPNQNLVQRIQGAVQTGFGLANSASALTPVFSGANLIASVPRSEIKDADIPRRFSSGILNGISGQQGMATNVPERKTNLGPLGEADLIKTAGSMYGFTQNPAWKQIFGQTGILSDINIASNPVTNFIATRGIKGGIEGLIQGLGEMPEGLTDKEKASFVTNNILGGIASEIIFDAATQGATKGIKRVWNGAEQTKVYAQAYDQLRNARGQWIKMTDRVRFPGLEDKQIEFIKQFEAKYNAPETPLRPKPQPTKRELEAYKQFKSITDRIKLENQSGKIDFGAKVGDQTKQTTPEVKGLGGEGEMNPKQILTKIDQGTSGLPGAELNQQELDVLGKYLRTNGDTSLRGKITEGPNGTRDVIFGTIKDRNFKGQTEYLVMADSGPYKGAFRLHSTPIDSKFFGTKIVGGVGGEGVTKAEFPDSTNNPLYIKMMDVRHELMKKVGEIPKTSKTDADIPPKLLSELNNLKKQHEIVSKEWQNVYVSPSKGVGGEGVKGQTPEVKGIILKPVNTKDGMIQRIVESGLGDKNALQKMSVGDVEKEWTKLVSNPQTKTKLLEGANRLMVGSTPEVKPIKITSANQPALPKLETQPQNLTPNKTSLLTPETQVPVKTSEYPSPNVNTNRLNVPTKAKDFVDQTVEEVKPQIEKVIGKKLSNKEAMAVADNSAKVLNKAVTRQETIAWEAKMLKARELLSQQASDGKVTQEYLDNLIAVKSQGTDIARKLQSLSIGADPKEVTAKQAILEAVLKVTDNADEIINKAKGVDFNDYEQAASFYRQFVKPGIGDWLDKIRYSSMLSSPNTHINNFSSNYQGTGIIAPVEKTITGGVDKILSIIKPGRERQQFTGEGVAYAKGYYSNLNKAWINFKDTISGKKLSSAQEMYNLPLSSKGTVKRGIEGVLEVPGKFLQAADEFFQALTSGGVEKQLEYRQSKGIKISGIEDKAYLEARKRLFNSEFGLKEEGPLLKAIEFIPMKVAEARASSNPVISAIAKYSFPFVRVPSNILKASVEYGPLGVGTLPGASNKVEQLSKALLGTSVGLLTASLVAGDNMTWAEPTDQTKRNAFRAAGMQPYSIRVGDKWYSYSKMHPAIAFNLAMVAAIRDSEKNQTLDDTQIDTLLNGVAKWVNFYADMSYVKNIGDATSGIKGDINASTRQISNYVQQLIPFRALMGWVARLIDPQQRQVDPDGSLLTKQLQQLSTQIPLLSQSVPARLDSKGNPIENQNRTINAFSPIRITNVVPSAETTYKTMVTKSINTKNENIVKDRVATTGQEEVFNGKKYYVSKELDSKTGEYTPVVKSIAVPQSVSQIYEGLDKKYQQSEDAPKNFIQKIKVYGTGIFKDPKGTISAIKNGEPIRKVRGDAVVVERLNGLSKLDEGDTSTEVDHIIAVSLGGNNDESNLQIISKQDNRVKGVVDTYLSKELEAGRITKKEAQERDLNWRQEITNLPSADKAKVQTILDTTPPPPAVKISSDILSTLSNREYNPIYNADTQTYSNVQVKIPEFPQLSGETELDKQLKSKYYSALTTAKTNIGKLYLDGQITAKEAEAAIKSLIDIKSKTSGSKAKKIPKIANIKISYKPLSKSKKPALKGVTIAKLPNLKLAKVSNVLAKLPAYKPKNIKIMKVQGLTVGKRLA
jgi:hypothetical protein